MSKMKIFESATLGPLPVKNRLIMAPMGTRLASEIGGGNAAADRLLC